MYARIPAYSSPYGAYTLLQKGFIGLGAMGKHMARNLARALPLLSSSSSSSRPPTLVVYDAHTPAMDAFLSQVADEQQHSARRDDAGEHAQVIPALTPASVFRRAATVFTMLPSHHEARAVFLGDSHDVEAVDSSSSPSGARQLAEEEGEGTSFADEMLAMREAGESERLSESLVVDCTTGDRQVSIALAQHLALYGVQMLDAPVSGGAYASLVCLGHVLAARRAHGAVWHRRRGC